MARVRDRRAYVYLDRPDGRGGKLAPQTQVLRDGGRVAVQFPTLGGCVELHVTQTGQWSVLVGPAAGAAGEFIEIAAGEIPPQEVPS